MYMYACVELHITITSVTICAREMQGWGGEVGGWGGEVGEWGGEVGGWGGEVGG